MLYLAVSVVPLGSGVGPRPCFYADSPHAPTILHRTTFLERVFFVLPPTPPLRGKGQARWKSLDGEKALNVVRTSRGAVMIIRNVV